MSETQPTRPRHQCYYIWTVGCQMNISDSARLEAALQSIGYSPAHHPEAAGFIVLNSCSVRASAEERIIGKLGELQRIKRAYPDTRIILWGCMVDADHHSPFQQRLPMVDHFVAPSALGNILALAPYPLYHPDEPALPIANTAAAPVSVSVPIQYGCNMRCSYCIIPQRRGREQSRPLDDIVAEVARILEHGAKEIILLGQIVDSWGHDLPGKPDLSALITAVHDLPGLERLRFLTSHPAWMTHRLIETIAHLPRCQHEVNLPIQSGHNAILKRMQRGYTQEHYRDLIHHLRRAIPDIAMTTDIIVGHPGERQEHFDATAQLVQDLCFDKIHIAAFSARPGTLAAEQEQDPTLAVPPEEKQARRIALEQQQQQIATRINEKLLGTTVEILVEDTVKGKWRGRTSTNKLVFFNHPANWRGQRVPVHITATGPWSLQGQLSAPPELSEKP